MPIVIMVRVFVSGSRDRSSLLGRVIPKTQKMILDFSLLNTKHYKVRVMGNWNNPGKGVVPFPNFDVVAI